MNPNDFRAQFEGYRFDETGSMLLDISCEMQKKVEEIGGVYFDACLGFQLVHKELQSFQSGVLSETAKHLPQNEAERLARLLGKIRMNPATVFKDTPLQFLPAVPNPFLSEANFTVSWGLERNLAEGTNQSFLANTCVVVLYHFWEDVWRKRLAELLGAYRDRPDPDCPGKTKRENLIKSALWTDLGLITNSLKHKGGKASSDLEKKAKKFKFKTDTNIVLTAEMMREILCDVYAYARTEVLALDKTSFSKQE